jgi:IS30 family transposase
MERGAPLMKYTLGQAAKATGKAKSTILRAIKNGTLSASKGAKGSYQIDPAELHRVFESTVAKQDVKNDTQPTVEQVENLQIRLKISEEERSRERSQHESTIYDLSTRHDRVTGLLAAPPTRPRRWWQWK